jgi:hypothetical protein
VKFLCFVSRLHSSPTRPNFFIITEKVIEIARNPLRPRPDIYPRRALHYRSIGPLFFRDASACVTVEDAKVPSTLRIVNCDWS